MTSSYTPDERGSAQRIADEWINSLAWSEEMKKWMVRREGTTIWKTDTLVEHVTKAMITCSRQGIDHNTTKLTTRRHMMNALELAKPILAVELSDFDLQPWALNTPTGLINLQTCEYVPVEQVTGRYMMTTRVSPQNIDTPLWDAHLSRMCKGDLELIGYLKRLAGLTLIGDQNLKPHVSPQLNGLGRNGKGVFLQGLGWVLGDYAQFSSSRLLTTTENAHTTEQAGLRGMRLVVIEEVKRINSSILKDLTGGGSMRARKIRQDDVEFQKTWTLWFNNNGPMLFSGDTSDGLWQRVPRIDLGEGIPASLRIDDMAERIKEEAPGILQWMIDGLIEFRTVGLQTPKQVQHDSEIARADADPVLTFIRERYEFVENEKVMASEFMRDLTSWAKETGEISIGGRRAVYDEIRHRTSLKIIDGAKGKFWITGLKRRSMSFGELSTANSGLGWEDQINLERN